MDTIDKIVEERKKILELITLMEDPETPISLKDIYHNRCILFLTNYKGNDFEELLNKYLIAETKY